MADLYTGPGDGLQGGGAGPDGMADQRVAQLPGTSSAPGGVINATSSLYSHSAGAVDGIFAEPGDLGWPFPPAEPIPLPPGWGPLFPTSDDPVGAVGGIRWPADTAWWEDLLPRVRKMGADHFEVRGNPVGRAPWSEDMKWAMWVDGSGMKQVWLEMCGMQLQRLCVVARRSESEAPASEFVDEFINCLMGVPQFCERLRNFYTAQIMRDQGVAVEEARAAGDPGAEEEANEDANARDAAANDLIDAMAAKVAAATKEALRRAVEARMKGETPPK
jgi:hypothetical protein